MVDLKEKGIRSAVQLELTGGSKYILNLTHDELSDIRDAMMLLVITPSNKEKRFKEDSYFELPLKISNTAANKMLAFRASSIASIEFLEELL